MAAKPTLAAIAAFSAVLAAPLLIGCGLLNSILPSPTPTPTPSPPPTSTPTPLPSPTATSTATVTPAATAASGTRIEQHPDGSHTFTDHEYGYAISFSADWLVLELGEGDLEQIIDLAAELVPDFQQLEGFVDQLGPGARLYAADLSEDRRHPAFVSNVNVLIAEIPGALTMDFLVALNSQSLPQLLPGAEVIDSQVTTNPQGVELGIIGYTYPLGELEVDVFVLVALMRSGDSVVTITGGSAVELQEVMQPVFLEILDGVRRIEADG